MKASVLTKSQFKTFKKTINYYDEHNATFTVVVRFDDRCGNGHNSFSITGDISKNRAFLAGGCIHEEICKHFPELAKYIKWHLCATDGPMYYVANAMYHAKEIPEKQDKWYFYLEEKFIRIVDKPEKEAMILKYGDNAVFKDVPNPMAKKSDLKAARSCAVWPEASLEDFTEEKLLARLPKLLEDFRTDVEELGFIW